VGKISMEIQNTKKKGYFSLLLFCVGIVIGLLDYLYLGEYFILITILSFAVLAASIGMFWEKHKRISKYLSVLLMATAGLFLYGARPIYSMLCCLLLLS